MSGSPSVSINVSRSSFELPTQVDKAKGPAPSEGAKGGPSAPGKGALKDHQVAVGSGAQRTQGKTAAETFKSGLKSFGMGLFRGLQGAWAVATLPVTILGGLALGTAQLGKVIGAKITGVSAEDRYAKREAKAEQRFIQRNQDLVDALKKPQGGPAQSLAAREEVVDRLFKHAQMTGKAMSKDEIRDLVATGENITKAIQGAPGDKLTLPVKVTIDGKTHDVKSNTYTARAVGWFMMAQAAQQDVQRQASGDKTSDMTTSGSFVMKDPGNKMYDFLNSAPTSGPRMSTHFGERIGHGKEHHILGFIPTFGTKPQQRGIEDYQSRMPGQGGTMLFDKLKPGQGGTPELFVKFESAGCPPFFASEKHHGIGDRFLRFFASLDRNVHHCFNFAKSQKSSGGGSDSVVRQEHIKKGTLKATVYDPVKQLAQDAVDMGLVKKGDISGLAKSMGKYGMPAAQSFVARMIEVALDKDNPMLLAKAQSLAESIQDEMIRLGIGSDQHGIERRGAEVHIGLQIPPLVPGQATGVPAQPTSSHDAVDDDDDEVPLQFNKGKKAEPAPSVQQAQPTEVQAEPETSATQPSSEPLQRGPEDETYDQLQKEFGRPEHPKVAEEAKQREALAKFTEELDQISAMPSRQRTNTFGVLPPFDKA